MSNTLPDHEHEAALFSNVFFEIFHDCVQVVFFQENAGHADSAFSFGALGSRLGYRKINPHLFVHKRDSLIALDAGHKCATCVLLKHDLVGYWLAVEFHDVQGAKRHVRSSMECCPGSGWFSITVEKCKRRVKGCANSVASSG